MIDYNALKTAVQQRLQPTGSRFSIGAGVPQTQSTLTSFRPPQTTQSSPSFNQTANKPSINPLAIPGFALKLQKKIQDYSFNQTVKQGISYGRSPAEATAVATRIKNISDTGAGAIGATGSIEETLGKIAASTEIPVISKLLKGLGYKAEQISELAPKLKNIANPEEVGNILKGVKSLVGNPRIQSNLTKLAVSPEVKSHILETINQIKPELESLKGGVLSNQEVIEAAKKSDILSKNVSTQNTLNIEAALLRTRQHLAELAKGEVTPEFIDTLKVVQSHFTDVARQLQSGNIEASPELGSIKVKLLKDLLKLGKSTDEIVKAAEGVDFTNLDDVTKFYRSLVKPKLGEVLDEYRYINLLSSPKTHVVNAFSNILQTTLLRPATRLASGVIDSIGSKLIGKDQEFYVSQVPEYYKGVINGVGEATSGFLKAMKGESIIARPDIKQIPTGLKVFKPFQVIPRLLEASDVFFRTLATHGEVNALMSKGVPEAQAIKDAASTASDLVFRKALDPSNKSGQGQVLATIDKLTNAVYGLRKVPGVKWFVPFVQTPMNILKQGIEYSPLGLSTLPGNTNKVEQLGKTLIGSTVFAGAGWMALNDRSTWAAPVAQKEKDAFYAAGMQPYSVKIGDKWVSYSRLGPLAYPMAMAAAIKFYTQQNPKSVTDTELQKITKILTGVAGFFADQSYVQGLGNFVDVAKGDTTAATQTLSNIPGQLIPLAALQRWVANLVDPIYRKSGNQLSVDSIIKNLEKGIPFLSKNLEAYKTPFGQDSERQYPYLNSVNPLGVSKEDKFFRSKYNSIQNRKKLDLIKQDIKTKLQEKIKAHLAN